MPSLYASRSFHHSPSLPFPSLPHLSSLRQVVDLNGAVLNNNSATEGGALYSANAQHVALNDVTATWNQGGSVYLSQVVEADLNNLVLTGSTPDDFHVASGSDVLVTGTSTLGSLHLDLANNAKLVLNGPNNHLFQFHRLNFVRGTIQTNSNLAISGAFTWTTGRIEAVHLPTGKVQ